MVTRSVVTAELLRTRQRELWDEYEALLKMGRRGMRSPEEAQVLRRLDWWDKAEREYHLAHLRRSGPFTGAPSPGAGETGGCVTVSTLGNQSDTCIHGEDRVCPDSALVACSVCASTGRWRESGNQLTMKVS